MGENIGNRHLAGVDLLFEANFLKSIVTKLKEEFAEFFIDSKLTDTQLEIIIKNNVNFDEFNYLEIFKIMVDKSKLEFDNLRELGWCACFDSEKKEKELTFIWKNFSSNRHFHNFYIGLYSGSDNYCGCFYCISKFQN